jgi:hypothetical protein
MYPHSITSHRTPQPFIPDTQKVRLHIDQAMYHIHAAIQEETGAFVDITDTQTVYRDILRKRIVAVIEELGI